MLGAIAAEAKWLADGDDARFMNEVAPGWGRIEVAAIRI